MENENQMQDVNMQSNDDDNNGDELQDNNMELSESNDVDSNEDESQDKMERSESNDVDNNDESQENMEPSDGNDERVQDAGATSSQLMSMAEPYAYFYDNFLKDIVSLTTGFAERSRLIRHVKDKIRQEMNEVLAMREPIQDLINRWEEYKKS